MLKKGSLSLPSHPARRAISVACTARVSRFPGIPVILPLLVRRDSDFTMEWELFTTPGSSTSLNSVEYRDDDLKLLSDDSIGVYSCWIYSALVSTTKAGRLFGRVAESNNSRQRSL